jgi:hypothetical protein
VRQPDQPPEQDWTERAAAPAVVLSRRLASSWSLATTGRENTSDVSDERPPICPACGVTMVPAELSARAPRDRDWVCLECQETDELDLESSAPRPDDPGRQADPLGQ